MCEFSLLLPSQEQIYHLLPSPRAQQLAFLVHTYNRITKEMVTRRKVSTYRLEVLWADVLRDVPISPLPHRIGALVASLKVLAKLPPSRGFLLLMRCIMEVGRVIVFFPAEKDLARFVLALSSGIGFITAFVYISGLFMKNNDFQVLCSPMELKLWFKFEEVILNIVDAHDELSLLYHDFQDEVLMELAQV
jgi:hypothetical protein